MGSEMCIRDRIAGGFDHASFVSKKNVIFMCSVIYLLQTGVCNGMLNFSKKLYFSCHPFFGGACISCENRKR